MSRSVGERRGQAGVTLLEMLVVLAILSTAIITFAYGLQTATTTSADAKIRQKMHLALESFRSNLTAVVVDGFWRGPRPCPDPVASVNSDYLAALNANVDTAGWTAAFAGDSISFDVTGVRYWKGGPAFPVAGAITPGSFSGTCGDADQFAQEILLEVSQPTIAKPVTGSVVVRKPT